MKALILAAGMGSRLKQKTEDRPKALTLVAGKPILDYQLSALLDNHIEQIGIVLGRHGEMIQKYIEDKFPQLEVTFFWNHEYSTTNSSYSLWLTREWIQNESYIHLNCDIIFTPQLLKKLIESKHENIIAIRRDFTPEGQKEYLVLKNTKITSMTHTFKTECSAKAFGLAKFSSQSNQLLLGKIESFLNKGDKNRHYFGMLHDAINNLDYFTLEAVENELFEVNTLDDLTFAEKIYNS